MLDFEKAALIKVKKETKRKMLNGEITAWYFGCPFNDTAKKIMDYSKIGNMKRVGEWCPQQGEWIENIYWDKEKGLCAKYQTGTLVCNARKTDLDNGFFFDEKIIQLSDYGFPPHILYYDENCKKITYTNEDGLVIPLKWKSCSKKEVARYFMNITKTETKPLLDVKEEEALKMGFKPTNKPIKLSSTLSLLIDKDISARNALFLDFYNKRGNELADDPYIHYFEFEIIRK